MPECVFEELSALDRLCIGADGWSPDDFRTEVQKAEGIILGAYRDTELVGLAAGFTAADTGEILTVAVSPEYRRNGIAGRLMEGFFSLIPTDTENIALEVRQSNAAAIALYKSFGFEKAGVRKRFYRDPLEDADIMVCYLTNKEGS